jgi:hypothetical protein
MYKPFRLVFENERFYRRVVGSILIANSGESGGEQNRFPSGPPT